MLYACTHSEQMHIPSTFLLPSKALIFLWAQYKIIIIVMKHLSFLIFPSMKKRAIRAAGKKQKGDFSEALIPYV